jgi:hypothetical protein
VRSEEKETVKHLFLSGQLLAFFKPAIQDGSQTRRKAARRGRAEAAERENGTSHFSSSPSAPPEAAILRRAGSAREP